jgi:membrane dipeptidase
MNRRDLMALGAAALASPAAAATDPLAGLTVINALGGLNDPNLDEPPRAAVSPRILKDAHASGTTAVNVTVGFVAGPMEPFQHSVAEVAQWQALIRQHRRDLTLILSTADIARAKAEKKVGVILGFQNAAMMGDDPGRADIFADMGVRVIQLTYNLRNQLGDGSIVPEGRGLTDFGRQVVDRLNANRVMVDLSHSGRQICLDAARYSKQPISINHTGCRALVDLPRNKTDEELKLVADRGGFVGVYFMPFLNLSGHARAVDVVAHIEHALNVCGEDHVGIGTDGGTTPIDDLDTTPRRSGRSTRTARPRGSPRRASGPTRIRSSTTCAGRTSSASSTACSLSAATSRRA